MPVRIACRRGGNLLSLLHVVYTNSCLPRQMEGPKNIALRLLMLYRQTE